MSRSTLRGNRIHTVADAVVPRRGRPRKFNTPSRAVTLTLPNEVIEALSAIDPDMSRAVVRVMQPELGKQPHSSAELASFGRHAVIVVSPSRTFERRTGVLLVPLPDGRALISFDEPKTIPELELQLQDLTDDPHVSPADRSVFDQILHYLRDARRSRAVSVRRQSIIVFETARTGTPRDVPAPPRRKSLKKIS